MLELVLKDTDLMWEGVLAAIDGLTPEEFFWEPVDGCWTLRAAADGGWVQDWTPAPPVAPFTTIAWRLAHIGQSLASHAHRLVEQGSFSYATYRPAGSVEGERAFLEASFASWRAGIASAGDGIELEVASEVLRFNHHHLGHAKEIDTIRQLFRAQRPLDDDPIVAACLGGDAAAVRALAGDEPARRRAVERHPDLAATAAAMGRWEVVATLVDLGWPPDGAPPTGPTALHYAAGLGPSDLVRKLLDRGADPLRRDPEWNATARGWADFYANQAALDCLP